jgi:hypothetical protein
VDSDTAWAGTLRRFARIAVWTLPAYALALFVAGVLEPDRLDGLVAAAVAAWLGPVSMVALTALLTGVRSRHLALAGLLAGLAAGGLAYAATGDSAYSDQLGLAAGAALTLAWWLYGAAVLTSRVYARADGVLLLIAAPLLGVGGAFHDRLPAIGALLLLAGGLGMAWTATRLLPGPPKRRTRAAQSRAWS